MTKWEVYWIAQADCVHGLFVFLCIVSWMGVLFPSLGLAMSYSPPVLREDLAARAACRRFLYYAVPLALALSFCVALIPKSKTIREMYNQPQGEAVYESP